MTLEEAIIHCEEVVKQHENKKALTAVTLEACQCAEEHRQIADWLKLLQRILDSGDCNVCGIRKVCQIKPNLGEMVRYNCPLFVERSDKA